MKNPTNTSQTEYKKLVHTFKHEAVQFFVAKNLAVKTGLKNG